MMKKVVSLLLVFVLALGITVPVMAYSTLDFSDVPQGHWAYESVMKMADKGVIKGVGEGRFAPEDKLTAEMFIVLVGRVVFPEVKAEGADWSGPYVSEAKAQGFLTGTNVTDATLKGEISRYDMAVILAKCVEILKVSATKADANRVTDYGDVPNRYTDAVLMAYGSGLIQGDQTGRFNGGNSMTRQEAATVMDRLLGLKGNGSQGETTDPEVTPSQTPELKTVKFGGWMKYGTNGDPEEKGTGVEGVPFQLRYTKDNGTTYTVIAEDVTQRSLWHGDDTPGYFKFTADVEENLYNDIKAGKGQLYVSAETTANGQRYVTQDRRTDGKATIVPIGAIGTSWTRFFVDLIPPDRGETVDITVVGSVTAHTYVRNPDGGGYVKTYSSIGRGTDFKLTDCTVRIYYDSQQEGTPLVLIGDVAAEDGQFHDTISIDTAYYRTTGAHYVVKIEARLDGQLCVNSTSSQAPITLSELTGKRAVTLWRADSDEYFEDYLGHPRP